jgi:hypothetical protein
MITQQQQQQQQHQAQRMQPPPTSTPTHNSGQRTSPYGGVLHNTPPNAGSGQSQFSTPQNSNQTNLQTSNNNQQGQVGTILTPQTPNFPPGSQGAGNAGTNVATPLSPGSEAREKERVTLLLDINRELLAEAMRLQAAQAEAKKEEPAASTADGSAEKEKTEKEKADKIKSASGREYIEYVHFVSLSLLEEPQTNLSLDACAAFNRTLPTSPPSPTALTNHRPKSLPTPQ